MAETYKEKEDSMNRKKINCIAESLPEFMKRFFFYLTESRKLSTRTALGYAYDLETFCFYLKEKNPAVKEYKDITPQLLNSLGAFDIDEYMFFLSSYSKNDEKFTNSAIGKARKLSSLKSFWKWMLGNKIVKNDPTLLISSPKINKKEIINMNEDETKKVLKAVNTGVSLTKRQKVAVDALDLGPRDNALINLLLSTGMRVSECVGIDLNDLNLKENSVKIIRKGGDENKVYFNDTVKNILCEYINKHRKTPSDGSDALFISAKGNRLCVRSVERVVKKYIEPLGLNKNITTHKLRSTYATALYQKSHDIYLTADALGHKNVVTTSRYANIGDSRRKEAASYIDF